MTSALSAILPLITLALLCASGCISPTPSAPANSVTLLKTNYHGWPDSLILRSSTAEVAIVPSIGRIMQFGFLGEEGVLWENRTLDGVVHDPNAREWVNFGGDKTWPSPEGDWSKFTKHQGWKPPQA